MKSRLKKLEGTARLFEIEMPRETVDRVFNEVLENIRKDAAIAGFRPGNAPMDIIRKKHGEEAMDEAKKRLITRGYQQALEEHDVSPISYPEVSDIDLKLSGELTFKAKVDIHPELNLRPYKGIKVTTYRVSVSDKEVEETLERLRNMHAEFTGIDRPLQDGDFGICDVETFMDGQLVSKKRENMWIEVDKEASMLGVGSELRGLKKGDSKEIEVTLPGDFPDKKYAGKKAVFKVEVKDTKEKKLPELDDGLAKKLGKETIGECKEEIKTQLMERKEAGSKVEMENQILEEMLKKNPVALPESLVKRQMKVLMDRAEDDLAKKGLDKGSIESHRDKLKAQLRKEAEDKVKAYFLLSAVADRENIEVTDEETDNWLSSLAASYNKPFEDIKKYYEQHDLIGGLREQLREEKTLDFLLSEAAVTIKEKK